MNNYKSCSILVPQNIVILGAGRSGKAAARLAECLNLNAKIMSDDDTPASSTPGALVARPASSPPGALVARPAYSHNFDNSQLIVVSPGIPPGSPLYREAVASGKEIISELEFAARHFSGKYLAVTGTNGKTTTTELVAHLWRALKINA
ncbi:MAG: hypothetical protein KAS17_05765, partial [Victivallaceae bacterium]|nr:hypothetical protein [Victivallaceae bacterium]